LKEFVERFASPTHELVRGEALEKNRLPPNRFAALVELQRTSRRHIAIPAEKDAAFQAMVAAHPERQFIVVVAPFHRSYYESYPDFDRLLEYVDGLARAHANVVAFTFNGRELDDGLFYDTVHFNATGARVFSLALRERLDARGIRL